MCVGCLDTVLPLFSRNVNSWSSPCLNKVFRTYCRFASQWTGGYPPLTVSAHLSFGGSSPPLVCLGPPRFRYLPQKLAISKANPRLLRPTPILGYTYTREVICHIHTDQPLIDWWRCPSPIVASESCQLKQTRTSHTGQSSSLPRGGTEQSPF